MTVKTESNLSKRFFATLIDYGFYILFFIWAVTTFGEHNGDGSYSLNGLKGMWVEIVWFIYFPVIEFIFGQTLGKKILGLKVITKSGNPISFWQAIKRHLLDIIDFSFFGIVAFITIKNTPEHQRLGDLWAKTIVIGGESFYCTNCKEQLTLTPDEIIKKEFKCPLCNTTNTI